MGGGGGRGSIPGAHPAICLLSHPVPQFLLQFPGPGSGGGGSRGKEKAPLKLSGGTRGAIRVIMTQGAPCPAPPPGLSPPPHRGSQSSSIGVGLPPWCRLGLESQRGEGVTQAEAERSWPPGLLLTCEEKVTAEMESGPREGSRPGSGPRLASPSLPGPVPRTDTPRKFMLSAKVDSVPSAEDCPSWVTATAVRQACCLQGSQSTASSRPSVGAGAAPWPAAGCTSCTEAYD